MKDADIPTVSAMEGYVGKVGKVIMKQVCIAGSALCLCYLCDQ
jgi:hypothetical protein